MPSEIANNPSAQASNRAPGPSSFTLVVGEILRALGQALALPFHAFAYWRARDSSRAEVRADLQSKATFATEHAGNTAPVHALRIFVSCAEASGETHAVNFVGALRSALTAGGAPHAAFVGLGGARLSAIDVEIVGDPVAEARMGFSGIVGALPFYLGLVRSAANALRSGSVDLFVGVDSPALNVPLAHIAKRCGVPTVQYITPQYWGWAPWRARGFRQAIDLALSILPFEPAWFARRGIEVAHVGHPLLDELEDTEVAVERGEGDTKLLAVLPGSRGSVIRRNLPIMLKTLSETLAGDSQWRIRLCQGDDKHRDTIDECLRDCPALEGRVELSTDLENELKVADAALSVSGTILIHLLRHGLPTVVLYSLESPAQEWMGRHFLTVPYFSSVNLLAGDEVYPEFSFAGDQPPIAWSESVGRLLKDSDWRARCRSDLARARRRLGPAGASRRAAAAALQLLAKKPR